MNEFIPQDLEPVQIDKLGRELANEVARLGKVVAGYESDYTAKLKLHKLELAKAKILHKDSKYSPTMINALSEVSTDVVQASNYLQLAEATLIIGKAEHEARDKQYTMVKKLIDLKVQEMRTFRG